MKANQILPDVQMQLLSCQILMSCRSHSDLPYICHLSQYMPLLVLHQNPPVSCDQNSMMALYSTTSPLVMVNCTLVGNFFECHEKYCDDQNGFRNDRSCEDHIFSLSTVARDRIFEGSNAFCAFIEMKKAFDWVEREFLFYVC